MKQFMDKDFMLQSETAKKLFHDHAAKMPIIDYHCHLSPKEMYEDEQFSDIGEIFLSGDHYKWRYMRSCGIDEEYITGKSTSYEQKFKAFCGALQYAIGNPLYHWTHLELNRYFGITDVVRADTAQQIWDKANKVIEEKHMTPSYLINNSNVAVICTTDDPIDTLEYHKAIAEKGHIKAKVIPAFRPDKMVNIEKDEFPEYAEKLGNAAGMAINSFDDLIAAVYNRVDFFHENGCRVSDHGLDKAVWGDLQRAGSIFEKRMKGETLTQTEIDSYKAAVVKALGEKYAEKGWTMQLHMGALRNNNVRMYKKLGPDTGFDSVADYDMAESLSKLLNSMDEEGKLPKTILYTLNPKDNYVIGTMLGNFQSAEAASKLQFGSAWWINDQRDGMTEQLKALGNLGALCKFVGMLTDSRSFLSYTRHEYFRRILCDLLGKWVENGEFPADLDTLGKIVEDICYNNAKAYFNM